MSTQAHRSDVITKTRQAASDLLNAYDKLTALANEWNNGVKAQIIDANGADPTAVGYTPGDFMGSNQGLMKADINQVLSTALAGLQTFVTSTDGKKLQDIRQ